MERDKRIFEDLSRVASGAMGAATGLKTEIDTMIKRQVEKIMANMEFVSREEFDAYKEIAAKARSEQEKLAARLEKLEKQLKNDK